MRSPQFITPDWPAPAVVRAAFTLRAGGVSAPPFSSLNLGAHVGDDPQAVAMNRQCVRHALRLAAEPAWLEQVHGADVVKLDDARSLTANKRFDAAVTQDSGTVLTVQVADCLPVLFAAADGSAIAAAHAGWRGLAAGVLESTIKALAVTPEKLLAWLGPAISQRGFEVGAEVRETFVAQDRQASAAFVANERDRWQCDLYRLAWQRLQAAGVTRIYGGGWCTYSDPARFFSYRRDGRTGRMAALIWLAA